MQSVRHLHLLGKRWSRFLEGCYTIADETMFKLLTLLADTEGIRLEPSALAGMTGPIQVIRNEVPKANLPTATHLVWGTGGSMVPENEMNMYYETGKGIGRK